MDDTKEPAGKKKWTSAEKRARTAELKAEREARCLALEATWKAQVDEHFRFLETDYGFHFVSVDGSHWWATVVAYQSPLVQVTVDRSIESDCVEMTLTRLVHGQVPAYPIPYQIDTPVNHLYFSYVLHNRAPEVNGQLAALTGLSDEQLQRSLAWHADALRTYCDDVLRGNLGIFDEEAKRRRQRAAERHQKDQERLATGETTQTDN